MGGLSKLCLISIMNNKYTTLQEHYIGSVRYQGCLSSYFLSSAPNPTPPIFIKILLALAHHGYPFLNSVAS